MKARCFVIGNPVTAQKLLAAGGPAVGLYLPSKILVFEDSDGKVHVAYDRLQQTLPNAQLHLYPDSSHGSFYRYPDLFVAQAPCSWRAERTGGFAFPLLSLIP